MTIETVLQISETWRLAHDGGQWILQKGWRHRGQTKWQAIAFVATSKRHLLRVLSEYRVQLDWDATASLEHLEDNYSSFLKRRTEGAAIDGISNTENLEAEE